MLRSAPSATWRTWVVALLAAALALVVGVISAGDAGAAPGDTIYSEDFSGPVGPEWSTDELETSPDGERHLGLFSNDTASLNLTGLPAHGEVVVELDIYVLDSMDGNDTGPGSGEEEDGVAQPDVFTFTADGAVVKRTTFGNRHPQAYPGDYPGASNPPKTGATAIDDLGYDESTTFRPSLRFPHGTDSLSFSVAASGLDDLDDESWGIDNVEVLEGAPAPEVETEIDKAPGKKLKTKKAKAKAKFKFSSPIPGATFECKLKKAKQQKASPRQLRATKFKPCTSPKKYKLKPGKYTFQVRAVADGVADPTPVKRKFKVVAV